MDEESNYLFQAFSKHFAERLERDMKECRSLQEPLLCRLCCPFCEVERKALRCDLLHELWSIVDDIFCRSHLLPYAFKDTIEKATRIFNERVT